MVCRQIMHFQEPTFMMANFYTPDPFMSYSDLSIVDNDTLEPVPQVFFQTRGRNYLPNKVCPSILLVCGMY